MIGVTAAPRHQTKVAGTTGKPWITYIQYYRHSWLIITQIQIPSLAVSFSMIPFPSAGIGLPQPLPLPPPKQLCSLRTLEGVNVRVMNGLPSLPSWSALSHTSNFRGRRTLIVPCRSKTGSETGTNSKIAIESSFVSMTKPTRDDSAAPPSVHTMDVGRRVPYLVHSAQYPYHTLS